LFFYSLTEVYSMSGFKKVGTDSQGDVSGKLKLFNVPSTNGTVVGPGDLVVLNGTASAAGVAQVAIGVASTANTGVVAFVQPQIAGEALSRTHLPASTAGNVLVDCDPHAVYEVAVANGPLAVTAVGQNCPAVVTAGTVNGSVFISNMTANATGTATTATLPLQIVALLRDADGVLGNRALVRINATSVAPGATGI
jgi:hypothetical protein